MNKPRSQVRIVMQWNLYRTAILGTLQSVRYIEVAT